MRNVLNSENSQQQQSYGTMVTVNRSTVAFLKLINIYTIRYNIYNYLCDSTEVETDFAAEKVSEVGEYKNAEAISQTLKDRASQDRVMDTALIHWLYSLRPKYELSENTLNIQQTPPKKIPPSLLNLMLTSKSMFADVINEDANIIPLAIRFNKLPDGSLDYYTLVNQNNKSVSIVHSLESSYGANLPSIIDRVVHAPESLPIDYPGIAEFKSRAKKAAVFIALAIGSGVAVNELIQTLLHAVDLKTRLFSDCNNSTGVSHERNNINFDGVNFLRQHCQAEASCQDILLNATQFINSSISNSSYASSLGHFIKSFCTGSTGHCNQQGIKPVTLLPFDMEKIFVGCNRDTRVLVMLLPAYFAVSLVTIAALYYSAKTVYAFFDRDKAKEYGKNTRLEFLSDNKRNLFFHDKNSLSTNNVPQSDTSFSTPLLVGQ